MAADIDFTAFFDATPSPYLVLDTDLVIRYVNQAYLQTTGRARNELIGSYFFDALPENPHAPDDTQRNLYRSLRRVVETGRPDTLVLQRYDIPAHQHPGEFEERWWSVVHTPILGPDGTVKRIVQRAEDVTGFIRSQWAGQLTEEFTEREKGLAAELYARARELHHLNEELRRAHARERQVAVTLQEAMLSAPDLDRHTDSIAVRYQPATTSLNVCGDWYDVVDLPPTATPRRSETSSATACMPRPSWGCSAAPSARPSAPPPAPPKPWKSSACTPAPWRAPRPRPRSRYSSTPAAE